MAKIALCWELGRGSGHLAVLAEFVQPLIQHGHEVCLIVQNLGRADKLKAFKGLKIYQAPLLNHSIEPYSVVNYSSVLLMCGYDDSKNLSATINGWKNIFDSLHIDFVIAEHSPTALVAAKIENIPSAMVGAGFVVPQLESPMPSIVKWESISDDRLQIADAAVIACVNEMLAYQNANKTISSVQALFTDSFKCLITVPELDHYGPRVCNYSQPSTCLFKNHEPIWPEKNLDKVFVYFDGASPFLPVLLKQLGSVPYSVLMVVPNIKDELIATYSTGTLKIQTQLVNIDQVAEQCKLVITHAAHHTVFDFLKKGIPPIMLSSTFESTMLSVLVGKQGLGFSGTLNVDKVNIAQMLNSSTQAKHIWENARIFAKKYQDNEDGQAIAGLTSFISEAAGKKK